MQYVPTLHAVVLLSQSSYYTTSITISNYILSSSNYCSTSSCNIGKKKCQAGHPFKLQYAILYEPIPLYSAQLSYLNYNLILPFNLQV